MDNLIWFSFLNFLHVLICLLIEVHWSSIVCLLCGSSIVSSFFLRSNCYFYGISMGFLWNFYWICMRLYRNPMIFLLDFYDMFIGLLWGFYWIPLGFPLFFGSSWRFHKDAYGIPIGFLLDFHEISMNSLWDFYRIPYSGLVRSPTGWLGCPWHFSWIPMTFLWESCRISMILWDFHDIPTGFLWNFYRVTMGVLLDSSGISIVCLWYFYGIAMGFPWWFFGI